MIASGSAQTRPTHSWTKRAVAPALLAPALWFRVAVAVSPLNEATQPVIELQPRNLRDRYLFIDEIEILASDVYEPAGEFVSEPIQLLARSAGVPTPIGELPPETSVELSYRRAGTEAWQATGWNDDYLEGPVQFRMLLRASADGRRAPLVSHIRLR